LSEGKKFRAVVLSKATMHSVANNPTDVLVTTPLRLLGALQSGQVGDILVDLDRHTRHP